MPEKYLRLEQIIKYIKKDSNVLDIGTDHCLLPILLLNKEITKKITASDISDKCLKTSLFNLQKNNYIKDEVKLIQSNGFENINNPNEFDYIVIAGLGGKTISEILINSKIKHPNLVLHCTNNPKQIRETLHKISYKIIDEEIVLENGIYNLIIFAKHKTFHFVKSHYNNFVGPILKKKNDQITMSYFKYLKNHYKDIYLKSNKKKFKKYYNWLEKVIKNEN